MVQKTLALGDSHFVLAQGQDERDLQHRIEAAVHAGGGFVDFVVVGNRRVSAFMTGAERIVVTVETVLFDERDTGNVEHPFGGLYDGPGSVIDVL